MILKVGNFYQGEEIRSELIMNKPNVINPHIIVTYHSDKPYYEILYYDVDKKDWMCGQ